MTISTIVTRSKTMKRGSVASYIAVAAAAAFASGVVAANVGRSQAEPVLARTTQLLTQALPDLPGREVRITLLERGPGAASPPHRHPGHHVFGYVIEGTYEFGLNNQPPRLLKAGDVFYEPPGALHSTSRNPSKDQNMKIVIFMVADQKNPSTVVQ
jgi:quercetin dioxygenase-like cupin family protein